MTTPTPPAMTTPPATTPAAVYARVSTLAQGEDWHTSLDVQAKECLRFAAQHDLTVDPHAIVKEPYTGTTLDRPAFERLLADMVRQGIHHLIMDKPDRVTREGQLTAAYFIYRLRDLGITLHLALSNFTVRDDITVSVFLGYALAAKLENVQRVANVQRTRREAAESRGRYVKGNRAPYGWALAVLDVDRHGRPATWRLVHDTQPKPGCPDGTYPLLLRMLRERQAGASYRQIALGLTRDGIPTSTALVGHQNARVVGAWTGPTVRMIVENPIHAGILRSLRTKRVEAPPDAQHPKRWVRKVPVPVAEQVLLPSDLVVDPPLTVEQHRWLCSQDAHAARGTAHVTTANLAKRGTLGITASEAAMGYGGLFTHADCGAHLRVQLHRVRTDRRPRQFTTPRQKPPVYAYYCCQRHTDTPSACPGVSVRAETLDALVWEAVVRDVLLVPGRLQELAEQQRQADMAGGDQPGAEVRRLRSMRAELLADQQSLMDTLMHARSAYPRRLAEQELAALEPRLLELEARLADAERVADSEERRQAVLADVQAQVGRYALALHFAPALPLPYRVALQRRVLRALGFRASVTKGADGRVAVEAELRLSAGQPGVWFAAEDAAGMAEAAAHEGLTGLFAPGAAPEMEEPVSEEALLAFLRQAGASLPATEATPTQATAATAAGTSAGTVTFLDSESSSRQRFAHSFASSLPLYSVRHWPSPVGCSSRMRAHTSGRHSS